MYIYPDLAQKSHRITGVANKETHQKYFTRTTSPLFNELQHLHVLLFSTERAVSWETMEKQFAHTLCRLGSVT